jgi:hypothetical protein
MTTNGLEAANDARSERRAYLLDIAIAVLLGIAAVGTAWAAYQASLWGSDEAEAFNKATVRTTEAALLTDQASQAWIEGTQIDQQDQGLFLEYAKAAYIGDTELALYLRESLMSPDLVAAIEWWEGTPEGGPLTPFVEENPNWVNTAYDNAAELDAEAQGLLDEAAAANEEANDAGDIGDDYNFVIVVFASALFMLGIAGVFRQFPVKVGMGSIGAVLLVVAFVQMAGLDRAS